MAIPVYLWLEDDSGRRINGSVDIKSREGSIEVIEFMHSIEQPIDKSSGKITWHYIDGNIIHSDTWKERA